MDFASLPHFCRKESSKSSRHNQAAGTTENCFSFDHAFHQQLYNYIKQQAVIMESISPIRQGSFYVDLPEADPDDARIAKTIETQFHKLENQNGLTNSLNGLVVNGNWREYWSPHFSGLIHTSATYTAWALHDTFWIRGATPFFFSFKEELYEIIGCNSEMLASTRCNIYLGAIKLCG